MVKLFACSYYNSFYLLTEMYLSASKAVLRTCKLYPYVQHVQFELHQQNNTYVRS